MFSETLRNSACHCGEIPVVARSRFADSIAVAVDGTQRPLPAELDDILPDSAPTVALAGSDPALAAGKATRLLDLVLP